jgi:tetratricopeptide (TPR) repeat protein/TolB-like protein
MIRMRARCCLPLLLIVFPAIEFSSQISLAAQKRGVIVLVLPFANAGTDARRDWLAEGLEVLTAERMSGEGRSVLSREEWQAAAERLGLSAAAGHAAQFSRATMFKLGEELDADCVVFGSFRADGAGFEISAQVLTMYPPGLSPAVRETAASGEWSAAHARLVWGLLQHVSPAYPFSRAEFTGRFRPLNLLALEEYVRGLQAPSDAERLRLWRSAAALEPAWALPALSLGSTSYELRDYASAAQWYARIPLSEPRGSEAAFYAGTAFLLKEELERADEFLTRLAERAAGSDVAALADALNNLGLVRARRDQWSEAVGLLQRAARAVPEDAELWFNLGLLQLVSGDAPAAVRVLREAARRGPGDATAKSLLILALERAGRRLEADAERESLSGAAVNLTAADWSSLARVKLKHDDSPARAGTAAALSPRRLQSLRRHLALGSEALKGEKWSEAERHFSAAALLSPGTREAHEGLAEVYRRQNRADDSIRELRAAIWVQDDAALRLRLARIYLELTPARRTEARAELRAALRLRPTGELLAEIQRALELAEGRTIPE